VNGYDLEDALADALADAMDARLDAAATWLPDHEVERGCKHDARYQRLIRLRDRIAEWDEGPSWTGPVWMRIEEEIDAARWRIRREIVLANA
jgi:hypothetical protein